MAPTSVLPWPSAARFSPARPMPWPRRWRRGCIRWSGRSSRRRCCGGSSRCVVCADDQRRRAFLRWLALAAATGALAAAVVLPPLARAPDVARVQGRARYPGRANIGRRLVRMDWHALDTGRHRLHDARDPWRRRRMARRSCRANRGAWIDSHVRARRGNRPHVEPSAGDGFALSAAVRPAAAARHGCRDLARRHAHRGPADVPAARSRACGVSTPVHAAHPRITARAAVAAPEFTNAAPGELHRFPARRESVRSAVRGHAAVTVLGDPREPTAGQRAHRGGTVLFRELRLGRATLGALEQAGGDPRVSHRTVRSAPQWRAAPRS